MDACIRPELFYLEYRRFEGARCLKTLEAIGRQRPELHGFVANQSLIYREDSSSIFDQSCISDRMEQAFIIRARDVSQPVRWNAQLKQLKGAV